MSKIFFQFVLIAFTMHMINAQPFLDRHATNITDAWLSCQATQNPVRERGISHWIMYDVGKVISFGKSTIWNFNVPERVNSYDLEAWSLDTLVGSTRDGIREFFVDVSLDKINWTEVGMFTLPEANASSFYEGFAELDFENSLGRYLVFTPITNYGGKCFGLSEVRIETSKPTSVTDEVTAKSEKIMDIIPNPAVSYFDLHLYNHVEGRASLLISDMQGRIMHSEYLDVKDKVFTHRVKLGDLHTGMYSCTVISGNSVVVKKLEIIH
ncbi:MAG: T9SS type A sorting domain-containing protein [Saprospiraceae bacterium]